MRNALIASLLVFSAAFLFKPSIKAEATASRHQSFEYPWIKYGSIFYTRLDSTETPVYFYRDSREADYLLSGSILGLECLLQNELRGVPPPKDLPNLLFHLFRAPSSAMISESLLAEYGKVVGELKQKETDKESLSRGSPARTDSPSERISRSVNNLRAYIEKTGYFASGTGWIVQCYCLRKGGEIFSYRFEFKDDWSIVSIEMRRIDADPELDHGILLLGL